MNRSFTHDRTVEIICKDKKLYVQFNRIFFGRVKLIFYMCSPLVCQIAPLTLSHRDATREPNPKPFLLFASRPKILSPRLSSPLTSVISTPSVVSLSLPLRRLSSVSSLSRRLCVSWPLLLRLFASRYYRLWQTNFPASCISSLNLGDDTMSIIPTDMMKSLLGIDIILVGYRM